MVDLENPLEFKKKNESEDTLKKTEASSAFAKKPNSKLTSFSMYKNSTVKKQKIMNFGEGKSNVSRNKNLVDEGSLSLSGSMVVDDGPLERGMIPKMLIVSDMMDKSHCRGPMHLVFDLM